MAYFPMMVDIGDKEVLIIGGGSTASRKAELMLDFGAKVTVISKEFLYPFPKETRLIEKSFSSEDITKADSLPFLVIAATDDRSVNESVAELCRGLRIPVNVVDDEPLCSFIFPAVLREKDVVVSVSSGGKSPLVTQYVKGKAAEALPKGIGDINEAMGRLRSEMRDKVSSQKERRAIYKEELSRLLKEAENDME